MTEAKLDGKSCLVFFVQVFFQFGIPEGHQYKFLGIISNNIEVYEEPVPRTKKIPHRAIKFKAGEENRNCIRKVCNEYCL